MDSLGSEQQESTSSSAQITIGYYNLRGKAQVCRLLAEYFGVSYVDRLFTLAEWDRFKTQHTKNWSFPDLPYLQENDFVITESVPMCLYLCDRFGPASFLGVSEADQALVTMYLWTIEAMANVITINCQQKSKEEMD